MSRMMRRAVLLAAFLPVGVGQASAAYRYGSDGTPFPDEGCADCTYMLGLRDGITGTPVEGVIVRWYVTAQGPGADQPARLQVIRPAPGGQFSLAAEQTASFGNGGAAIPARIPIRRGDRLGFRQPGRQVVGPRQNSFISSWDGGVGPSPTTASGSGVDRELLIAADIEPDLDGDGYGDHSQDLCPGDGDRAGACSGELVGPSLAAFEGSGSGQIPDGEVVATVEPGAARAPYDGVLTRWRGLILGGQITGVVLRPETGGTYRHVGETAATPFMDPGTRRELAGGATRVPVRAGDLVGLRGVRQAEAAVASAPDAQLALFGRLAAGVSWQPIGVPAAIAVFADFERDADGDGFGDETQDGCPVDPGRQGACVGLPPAPPDPPTPPTPPAPQAIREVVLTPGPETTRTLRPGTARLSARRLRYRGTRSLKVPLTCPASAESCKGRLELRVGRRSAGTASFALRAGQRTSVAVKLSARARRALRRGGKVSVRIVPQGPKAATGTLALTR